MPPFINTIQKKMKKITTIKLIKMAQSVFKCETSYQFFPNISTPLKYKSISRGLQSDSLDIPLACNSLEIDV